ncbi:MAG: response regulator transcription factor [Candidatus Aphodosoma sp.]
MNEYKILVVDDEEDICEILQFNLQLEGFKVDVAHSAEEAMTYKLKEYNLILLDVMMGKISGFRMMQLMRQNDQTAHIPIIFITARDTENDVVTGFNLGADDYIAKPFSIREVVLRVKAVARRTLDIATLSKVNIIAIDGLELNLDNKSVIVDNENVPFTKKEFELLQVLMENPNKVLSRDDLLKMVWSDDVCVVARTVDVNITRIRKKIGKYGSRIVARQGFGYSFSK